MAHIAAKVIGGIALFDAQGKRRNVSTSPLMPGQPVTAEAVGGQQNLDRLVSLGAVVFVPGDEPVKEAEPVSAPEVASEPRPKRTYNRRG